MDGFPDHPFWDFSLRVYGSDGVPPACLRLQERHRLDVNVVLYCCWLGADGRGALDRAQMDTLLGAVGDWHDTVVRAIRAVRTAMKGGIDPVPLDLSDALRRRIAKIEVDCEHAEQLTLAAAVAPAADSGRSDDDRAADAVANVRLYLAAIEAAPTADDRSDLAVILAPAVPSVAAGRIADIAATL